MDTGRTKLTRYHCRSNAHQAYTLLPDEITDIKSKPRFMKWVKKTFKRTKNIYQKHLLYKYPQIQESELINDER